MTLTETPNFWNNKHPLATQAEEFWKTLVPMSGNCTTLQGELIRASGRIQYDWYNNGWGCNNWSGAVQFIGTRFAELPVQPSKEVLDRLDKALAAVADQSHGEPMHMADDKATALVTTIHEIVVQGLIDNPTLIPNTEDMFEYQEPEYVPDSEDDEEDYFGDDEENEDD